MDKAEKPKQRHMEARAKWHLSREVYPPSAASSKTSSVDDVSAVRARETRKDSGSVTSLGVL